MKKENRMNILICNDDGISAKGIQELAKALSGCGKIYVFAPDGQRSASGHSITIKDSIFACEAEFPFAEKAWKVGGTPADCVKIGLEILRQQGISVDMIFSGINHGANLGTDVLYSGTVSAAVEGALNKIPSVALSVYEHKPTHFEAACRMAVQACRLGADRLPCRNVLNINVPDLPEADIKGVKITRLGPREYEEWFCPQEVEEGPPLYIYAGEPVWYTDLPENMDVVAAQEQYISVTPIHFDLTDHALRREVEKWGFQF